MEFLVWGRARTGSFQVVDERKPLARAGDVALPIPQPKRMWRLRNNDVLAPLRMTKRSTALRVCIEAADVTLRTPRRTWQKAAITRITRLGSNHPQTGLSCFHLKRR